MNPNPMVPMQGGGMGGGGPMPGGVTKVGGLTYNTAALLCYLPVLGINLISSLIWIFTEPKENKFLRFHAIQSLLIVVSAFSFIMLMVCGGVTLGFAAEATHSPGIAGIAVGVLSLVQLGFMLGLLVTVVVCMIKAYGNQMWKLPIIGGIAERRA